MCNKETVIINISQAQKLSKVLSAHWCAWQPTSQHTEVNRTWPELKRRTRKTSALGHGKIIMESLMVHSTVHHATESHVQPFTENSSARHSLGCAMPSTTNKFDPADQSALAYTPVLQSMCLVHADKYNMLEFPFRRIPICTMPQKASKNTHKRVHVPVVNTAIARVFGRFWKLLRSPRF